MLRVKIGGVERRWDRIANIEESWITQQILDRQADKQSPCVVVEIKNRDVNLALPTARCAGSSGGRRANDDEQRVIEIWRRYRLDEAQDVQPDHLIAFLNQLANVL